MSSLLVTIVLLLADGSPGKKVWFACPEIAVAKIGSDSGEVAARGTWLVLDARGACVINVPAPMSIYCEGYYDTQEFKGRIALTREHKVVTVALKETDGTEP